MILLDLVLSALIAMSGTLLVLGFLWLHAGEPLFGAIELVLLQFPGNVLNVYTLPYFVAALFTSIWLWLYAGSVFLSRILLKMNSGIGFLLRVTDVENQPFRSMGFVSVLIVSGLFLVGLPFVLL